MRRLSFAMKISAKLTLPKDGISLHVLSKKKKKMLAIYLLKNSQENLPFPKSDNFSDCTFVIYKKKIVIKRR